MKPTPSLCTRIRFSTKDVGKGFYRGNRTGSTGAHTPKGGYLIDYRKVRSFTVPDLKNFKLTPFVTRAVHTKETPKGAELGRQDEENELFEQKFRAQDLSLARRERAMEYLDHWRQWNQHEFQSYVEYQKADLEDAVQRYQNGEQVPAIERLQNAQR